MNKKFLALTLDGGGAKGFYTLGVLRELEAMVGTSICNCFNLIYGTSTGSIIASLLALGYSVSEVHTLYKKHVVKVVGAKSSKEKSMALSKLATEIFGELEFNSFKTDVGIVAVNWRNETPMIFKSNIRQASGRLGSFNPGFGCKISQAVQASCSAYPFFELKNIETPEGDRFLLGDGGYCANNPTLYGIADAQKLMSSNLNRIAVLNVGVGTYPAPKYGLLSKMNLVGQLPSVRLLQKTMEINTQSMERLRQILYPNIPIIRISETYTQPELAADLFESNITKLDQLHQRGRESFEKYEQDLRKLFM